MINGISDRGRTDIVSIGAEAPASRDTAPIVPDEDAVLPEIAEEIAGETRGAIKEM